MGKGHALHFGNNCEASIHNENEEAEPKNEALQPTLVAWKTSDFVVCLIPRELR